MKPSQDKQPSRRRFLQRGAVGAWLLGLGNALGLFAPSTRAAQARTGLPGKELGPEYTYDLSKYRKVDPKLISHIESNRLKTSLKEPRAIAIGPEDKILVAGDKALVVLSKEGHELQRTELEDAPRCLTVAADGKVYAGFKAHIQVFDLQGKRLASWEKLSPKTILTALAVNEERLFAADAGNRVVHFLDLAGKPQGQLGKSAGKPGPLFVVPSPYFEVALGAGNILWVANPGEHQVEAYSMRGEKEFAWGRFSMAIEGFCGCCNPVHFALLSDGRFVTSEKGLPRIKIYSNRGEFESVVAEPEQFARYLDGPNANPVGLEVAADSQDRILVADSLQAEIRVFTRKTKS